MRGMGFTFQLPVGVNTIGVAIEKELEQVARIVWWATCFLQNSVPEIELPQFERIHIGIDEADGIIKRDVIVECFGISVG